MKKVSSFAVALFFLQTFFVTGQDRNIVNSNLALVQLNPSFAGSNGLFRNQFSYRNYLPDHQGDAISYNNTLDGYLDCINAGVALTVNSSDAGSGRYKRTTANLIYAQYIKVSEKLQVIPSVQAGIGRSGLDINRLHYGDLLHDNVVWRNAMRPTVERNWMDLSAGLLFSYDDRLFAGGSVFHMNRPDFGHLPGYRMDIRISGNASYNIWLSDGNLVQATAIYRQQGKWEYTQLGLNAIIQKRLVAGLGMTNVSSMYVVAGYRWDLFSVQFVYDRMTSLMEPGFSANSYEINFSFNLRKDSQRRDMTSFEKL